MNQYAPFPSQLDWDIAKWAKLRGPGSTSFDELLAIPSVCVSLCLVESGQVMLFRYMRGFRHHSEPPKNSIRSSTTTYQGGHRFNVMKSCLATKYVRCTIETSSLAFAPCLETQTLPQCWCFSLRSTMSTRKKRSVCIMTYRLDGGGGARRWVLVRKYGPITNMDSYSLPRLAADLCSARQTARREIVR